MYHTRTRWVGHCLPSGDEDSSQSQLPLRDDTAFTGGGVVDMTSLSYLHEAAILYNLRTRFLAAQPYTYTGDICIAVNPYQWLDIYTEATRKEYFIFGRNEMPPPRLCDKRSSIQRTTGRWPESVYLGVGRIGRGQDGNSEYYLAHRKFRPQIMSACLFP